MIVTIGGCGDTDGDGADVVGGGEGGRGDGGSGDGRSGDGGSGDGDVSGGDGGSDGGEGSAGGDGEGACGEGNAGGIPATASMVALKSMVSKPLPTALKAAKTVASGAVAKQPAACKAVPSHASARLVPPLTHAEAHTGVGESSSLRKVTLATRETWLAQKTSSSAQSDDASGAAVTAPGLRTSGVVLASTVTPPTALSSSRRV